jgi:uncharacterized membrane protein YphA (DoxX/SURF4 family)
LLLLRSLLGVTVAWQASMFAGMPDVSALPWAIACAAWLSGAFLLAGWLTPASSAVAGASFVIVTVARDPAIASALPLNGIGSGCMIVVALAVSLLGPGAYSIDARWFGRREIVFTGDSSSRA